MPISVISGKRRSRPQWVGFVLPSLAMNYLGQARLCSLI